MALAASGWLLRGLRLEKRREGPVGSAGQTEEGFRVRGPVDGIVDSCYCLVSSY